MESEGSIAELGCLIKHPEISSKLLVVANRQHGNDSFIALGMLKYLENDSKVPIIFTQCETLDLDERQYISNSIQQRFDGSAKVEKFRLANQRHLLFLVVDFIHLLQVARLSDIQHLLNVLGLNYPKRRVEQLLFVLRSLGLIFESKVLDGRYFQVPERPRPEIEYSFKETGVTRVRWVVNFFAETSSDRWRAYAFKSLRNVAAPLKQEAENVA